MVGWLLFFLFAIVLFVLLYAPGAVWLSRFDAPAGLNAAVAPAISLLILVVTMTLFPIAGLHVGWYCYVLLLMAACLLGGYVNRSFLWKKALSVSKAEAGSFFLYLGSSLVLVGFIYVGSLDGPGSFIPLFDTASTLSTIRQFSNTGIYGPLFSVGYTDVPQLIQGVSYYPAVLHSLAALLVNATGCEVAESLNVVIFVTLFAVLPLSVRALIKSVFPQNRIVEIFGAFTPFCFYAFPWGLLTFGSLHTNLFSLVFAPAFISTFVFALRYSKRGKRFLWLYVVLVAAVLAVAHPGALFASGTLVVPLIVMASAKFAAKRAEGSLKRCAAWGGALLAVASICLVWVICFKLPPLRATVSYTWEAFYTPAEAISSIVGLSFADSLAHLVVCLFVLVGVLSCLKNREKGGWLFFSALLVAVIYYVDVTTDGPIKQLLGGFWYTDSRRIAAMLVIPLMPLLAYGLAFVYSKTKAYFISDRNAGAAAHSFAASLCLALVLLVPAYGPAISFYGSFDIPSPISQVRANLSSLNELSGSVHRNGVFENAMIDKEELEAGLDIASLIGDDDSVILNNSLDGSAFFYGVYNLNVLNRTCFSSDDFIKLRLQANEYVWRQDVKEILSRANVRYLLQLDAANGRSVTVSTFCPYYNPDDWRGVQSVDSATPGFELIYSKGDICLYRLTDL